MRILLVEDEPALARTMRDFLMLENYTVDVAPTVALASDALAADDYDAVVLDLTLPDGDGLDLLAEIQSRAEVPAVIMVTARGSVEDRIAGLRKGADDYLPKPFSLPELAARLHAVVRRRFQLSSNTIAIGRLSVSVDRHAAQAGGKPIELTAIEYKILLYLAVNKGRVVSRTAVAEHVWGSALDERQSLDFVNVHIKNLRKKLSAVDCDDCIKTIYGVGYKAEEPDNG